MILRSPLIPLVVIVLSFGQLVLAGRGATRTVAENLRNPLASAGGRIVDVVEWSPPVARVHELTFTRPENGPIFLGEGARLKVQLWSKGRTRILAVRPAGSDSSRWSAFVDVLRGRGRLQVVADRKWVDLGPLPADGGPLTVQVAGLLPGPYGFAELRTPADPVFAAVRIVRQGEPLATARAFPRYRITVPAPVGAAETLARFFFFISISRVLQVAGLAALVLLFLGWRLLGTGRTSGAICCLVPSVVLIHAVCLPPLQGADETSHGATIEALLFRGMPIGRGDPYPLSWTLAAEWLDQDRIQYQPEEPLPLLNPEMRVRLAARLTQVLEAEASRKGHEAPAAAIQAVDTRSPLFFRPFQSLGPLLRPLSLINRISAYRLLSALSGLFLFVAGALLLYRAGLPEGATLAYTAVWVVPYMVFTTASTSNYAPAIGLGILFAACVLVLVNSKVGVARKAASAILVAGSWLGILVWPDFIFLAPVATAAVALVTLRSLLQSLSSAVRRAWLSAMAVLLMMGLGLFALVLAGTKVGNVGTRMPRDLPTSFDRNAFWMAVAVAAPLLLAAFVALTVRLLGTLTPERVRRLLAGATAALAAIVVVGFFLTPWTFIPYETERYWFSKLVREFLKAFLSNNLAWDQDVLSWKFFLGVGGWHDIFLPDELCALVRWALVALMVLFPILAMSAILSRPRQTAVSLFLSGGAASVCVVTLTLRYLQPGIPWGRFILPWLPFFSGLLLVLFCAPNRSPIAVRILVAGIALQLWISTALLGIRYSFGHG